MLIIEMTPMQFLFFNDEKKRKKIFCLEVLLSDTFPLHHFFLSCQEQNKKEESETKILVPTFKGSIINSSTLFK